MDTKGPTFRHKLDASYKANRPPMPEDLPSQISRCRAVADAFSIPIFEASRYEADDVLATLADQAVSMGVETWLATMDSDLIQLVRPGVSVFMYRPYQRDTVLYDSREKVRDRYGIDPIQMIDFKGLKGDPSDNISGVKGIGEKTAISLLNKYATIEEIYEHIDEVEPARAQRALIAGQAEAEHSKKMATISHDAPVDLNLSAAQVEEFDRVAVTNLFEELRFHSLIGRLPFADKDIESAKDDGMSLASPAEVPNINYEIVRTERDLKGWVKKAKRADLLAIDLETSSTDTMNCEIAGYSLAVDPGEAAYIPVHHLPDSDTLLPHSVVKSILQPLLEDSAVPKVLHNAKFDMKVMAQHGIVMNGLQDDSMLAAYLLGEPSIGLKALALSKFNIQMTPIEELIGKGKKQISMIEVSSEVAGPYAAADADMTLRLANLYKIEMLARSELDKLYRTVELPLIEVLVKMERTGIALDPTALGEMSKVLDIESTKIEQAIFQDVGHEFLIRSPKQLSAVLFEELELPKTRKTSQGYTTDAQALERLTDVHPVVEKVLQYRELTKLKSTYADTLPGLMNPIFF